MPLYDFVLIYPKLETTYKVKYALLSIFSTRYILISGIVLQFNVQAVTKGKVIFFDICSINEIGVYI